MSEIAHAHRCVVCNHLCVPHCECPEGVAARICAYEPPGMRSKHCLDLGIRKERERLDAEAAIGAEEWRKKIEELDKV